MGERKQATQKPWFGIVIGSKKIGGLVDLNLWKSMVFGVEAVTMKQAKEANKNMD